MLAITTGAPLSSLFSREQREFYEKHAPPGIGMDPSSVLGPTFLLKAKHQPKTFAPPVTVEMWLYPYGSRILESHQVTAAGSLPGRGRVPNLPRELRHRRERKPADEDEVRVGVLQQAPCVGVARSRPGRPPTRAPPSLPAVAPHRACDLPLDIGTIDR